MTATVSHVPRYQFVIMRTAYINMFSLNFLFLFAVKYYVVELTHYLMLLEVSGHLLPSEKFCQDLWDNP